MPKAPADLVVPRLGGRAAVTPPPRGLAGLREELVACLDDGEHANVNPAVEQTVPPALIVLWAEPWLERLGGCHMLARPAVTCLGGRTAPEAGVEVLEALVGYCLRRLADGGFAVERVGSPAVMAVSGVDYLACQVFVNCVIDIEQGDYPWPHTPS